MQFKVALVIFGLAIIKDVTSVVLPNRKLQSYLISEYDIYICQLVLLLVMESSSLNLPTLKLATVSFSSFSCY